MVNFENQAKTGQKNEEENISIEKSPTENMEANFNAKSVERMAGEHSNEIQEAGEKIATEGTIV